MPETYAIVRRRFRQTDNMVTEGHIGYMLGLWKKKHLPICMKHPLTVANML